MEVHCVIGYLQFKKGGTMNPINLTRRNLLLTTVPMAAGILSLAQKGFALCESTPKQTEGPFYPEVDPDRDNDLTQIKRGAPPAKGRVILVDGIVRDESCRPISGALIEIWQANAVGKYNHSADGENPAPLDPNFQHWGRMITNAEGKYWFKTILPGEYPASPTWTRTPHIHVKVFRLGYHDLTSQFYFSGESLSETPEDKQLKDKLQTLNSRDRILQGLTVAQQKLVVSPLRYLSAGEKGLQVGYDVTLKSVR